MSRSARTFVYVVLLFVGLSLTPARLVHTSLPIAAIGLLAFLAVQMRSTKHVIDYAFAWIALWALASVLAAPFIPAFHALGELARGAL
jgi:hypothetical protein